MRGGGTWGCCHHLFKMSDTPLTDQEVLKSIEAVVRFGIQGGKVTIEQQLVTANFAQKLERNVYEAEREIKDLTIRAQSAEKERDLLRELSLQLAKELALKCGDPVHRHQVSQPQQVEDFFKYRPQTMCTSPA